MNCPHCNASGVDPNTHCTQCCFCEGTGEVVDETGEAYKERNAYIDMILGIEDSVTDQGD